MSASELPKENKLKKHLNTLGLAALMVFTPLLGLELLLQITDPWGIRFYDDMALFGTALENDDVRGYVLPDGDYQFSNWQVTMRDGLRLTRNTNAAAACRIVVLGDSFTFGYGINDDETWLNQIARDFPDVYFLNTGITAYNSANVLGTYQSFPNADAYIYLFTNNDWEPNLSPGDLTYRNEAGVLPMFIRYISFTYHRGATQALMQPQSGEELLTEPIYQRFYADIQTLAQVENLYLLTWDSNFLNPGLNELMIDYMTVELPEGYRISTIDGHLNAAGNQVFAERLQVHIAPIVNRACS